MDDPNLQFLVDYLTTRFDCHTVILYGSRARGDFGPESDYDALGFRPGGEPVRDAFVHDGAYMDLFVYPETRIAQPDDFMHLLNGRVLSDRDGIGTGFLQAIALRYQEGPTPLARDEAAARRVWWSKMLARARKGDIEGNYRRVWLLTAMLEDYFQVRGLWYRGPKESLLWLQEQDPALYAAFDRALMPTADLSDISDLVERVLAQTVL